MNKIVSIKINAVFLAVILAAGTITLFSPSFMKGAHAQQDYETDEYTTNAMDMANEYVDEYKSPSLYSNDNNYYKSGNNDFIKKIKCNNINSNHNGVDVSLGVPTDDDTIAEAQAEVGDQSTTAANGWGNGERKDNTFRFVCINNNDNINNIEQVEKESNLIVNKVVSCQPGDMRADSFNACREFNSRAANAQPIVTPANFIITVTGNNPNPVQFEGSNIPIIVNLGFGDYQVSETADPSVATAITNLEQSVGVDITQSVIFSGDCNSVTGEGTIAEGDLQICSIENVFTATDLPPS